MTDSSSSIGTPDQSGVPADIASSTPSSDAVTERAGFFQKLKTLVGSQKGSTSREDFRELIEDGRVDHLLRPEEQRILGNLVGLEDQWVDDVMVPRADIVALQADMPIDDMIQKFADSGFSRLPVYRETLDDVYGMVHIKDLIQFWGAKGEQDIHPVMRDVMFVPPNMPVLDLLLRIQSSGVHMALVVDEYGGIDGLVTIEDLVEEVVGEIADSNEQDEAPDIRPQVDGTLIVDARVEVSDLEQFIGVDLLEDDREEDIDTIGGLVFDLADRVPSRGEEIAHPSGLRLIVMSADPRRVHTIRVIMPAKGPESA